MDQAEPRYVFFFLLYLHSPKNEPNPPAGLLLVALESPLVSPLESSLESPLESR
jgi:hypothetical protein